MLNALFERSINSVPWSTDDQGWGWWGGERGSGSWSGEPVTQESATQLLAVYGSASFITDEISTLPVMIDGGPRPRWVDHPGDGLERIPWMGQIIWSLLLSGNAYISIVRGGNRRILSMDVLDPANVVVRRVKGVKTYEVSGMHVGEIVHIPGRMRGGDLVGMSPIDWARQTIGLGLAATKYGAQFFDGEGNMPGVIEAPHPMLPETSRELARQWQRKRRHGGRGLPGVLQNGASWKPTGINHEQAQFLATRKWTSAEIAGQIFLLDPSDLGIPVEGSSLTYANLEQRTTRRLQTALMPWMRRVELALSGVLGGGAAYKFDVDSRLRGNTRESYETLQVAIDAGFLTVDESREIIGKEPLPATATPPPPEEPDEP